MSKLKHRKDWENAKQGDLVYTDHNEYKGFFVAMYDDSVIVDVDETSEEFLYDSWKKERVYFIHLANDEEKETQDTNEKYQPYLADTCVAEVSYNPDGSYTVENKFLKGDKVIAKGNKAIIEDSYSTQQHLFEKESNAKYDSGKLHLSYVPSALIYAVAYIREYGNAKYHDPNNWLDVEWERYYEALLRHVELFKSDPKGYDDESGLPHLWHIACNVAFLCQLLEPMYCAKLGIKVGEQIDFRKISPYFQELDKEDQNNG